MEVEHGRLNDTVSSHGHHAAREAGTKQYTDSRNTYRLVVCTGARAYRRVQEITGVITNANNQSEDR
jgi:hypothetical protein